MDRINVPCPECGTVLGVPAELAGKKVRCSSCKAVFGVPVQEGSGEVPALPAAEEEERPAGPGKRAAKSPAEPAKGPKAGGRPREDEEEEDDAGEQETAGRERGRSRGRTRKGGDGRARGKAGKSPVLLIAAGGGAVAAIIVVVALLLIGGKSGETGKGDGKTAGREEARKSTAKDKEDEKRERYERVVAEAETWEQWFRAGCLAEELKLPSEAKKHWQKALEIAKDEDAEPEKIFRKLGYEQYSLPELDPEIRDEPGLLGDLVKQSGTWLSPEELKAARAKEGPALKAARDEIEKRKSDPFYAKSVEIRKKIGTMKGFDRLLFSISERDPKYPYIVFEHIGEKGKNPYRSDEAAKLQADKMIALKAVYDFMNRTFMEPLNFSPPKETPLVVVSLEDREAFETYNKDAGMDLPPNAAAYFHIQSGFVVMNNGKGSNVFSKEEDDSTLFHEATHQILHYFSEHKSGSEALLSHWFNEGCAEYVGQIRETQNADGSYVFTPAYKMSTGRLRSFYMARFPEKFEATRALGIKKPFSLNLEQMVQCVFMWQTTALVTKKWIEAGGTDPKDMPPDRAGMAHFLIGGLIYGQAPSFFFFCYKAKPEYAPKMNEYFRKEMERKVTYRGAATFKQCFGIEDFAALEKEWLDYVDSVTTYEIKQGH